MRAKNPGAFWVPIVAIIFMVILLAKKETRKETLASMAWPFGLLWNDLTDQPSPERRKLVLLQFVCMSSLFLMMAASVLSWTLISPKILLLLSGTLYLVCTPIFLKSRDTKNTSAQQHQPKGC